MKICWMKIELGSECRQSSSRGGLFLLHFYLLLIRSFQYLSLAYCLNQLCWNQCCITNTKRSQWHIANKHLFLTPLVKLRLTDRSWLCIGLVLGHRFSSFLLQVPLILLGSHSFLGHVLLKSKIRTSWNRVGEWKGYGSHVCLFFFFF